MRFILAMSVFGLCVLAATMPASAEQQTPASVEQANARIAAVQAHIDAYRSGDLDRFVATFAKDAEVHAMGMTAIGHRQIKEIYRMNFQPGSPSLQIYDNGMDGDMIWVSAGYVYPNGEQMCCSLSEYRVQDGKISFLRSNME